MDLIRLCEIRILHDCCRYGSLQYAQQHHAINRYSSAEIRADSNYALLLACEHGHLAIAAWLHETFGLTTQDARDNYNVALLRVCAAGRLEVARWLHATFGLTAQDARECCALGWACDAGHLELAQWLHRTFRLTAEDIRGLDWVSLLKLWEQGNLKIVRFLHESVGLTADDISPEAIQAACEHDQLRLMRWVQRAYGICPAWRDPVLQAATSNSCTAYLRSLRTLRWSPRTHARFPRASRRAARAALLVRERQAHAPDSLPPLSTELWLHILSYLPSW